MRDWLRFIWRHYIRKLWSSFDRLIGIVSLLLAVGSGVLAFLTNQTQRDWSIFARDLTLFFVLFITILILALKYVKRDREAIRATTELRHANDETKRTFELHQKQLERSHLLIHEFRNVLFEHLNPRALEVKPGYGIKSTKLEDEVFLEVTNKVKEELKEYLSTVRRIGPEVLDTLCVAIDVVASKSQIIDFLENPSRGQKKRIQKKKWWVIRVWLDGQTYVRFRNRANFIYTIERNTAYQYLWGGPDRFPTRYLENNLHNVDNYADETKGWEEIYNARLVAPVRYRLDKDDDLDDEFRHYGFLSAEIMADDGQDVFDESCNHIMAHAADLLASFFLILEMYSANGMDANNQVAPSTE